MGYASIDGENSHCQSKKFKQRLKYRLDQGYTYDQAYQLASLKLCVLPNNLTPESRPSFSNLQTDENLKTKNAQKAISFRPDENSESFQKQLKAEATNPSAEEIRLEVERLKAAGMMTEIPPLTEIVSSANATKFLSDQERKLQDDDSDLAQRWPYWLVSGLASAWLVQSMTTSFTGHWLWNLVIAICLACSPMLILGANLKGRASKTAFWGAVGIFTLDLSLYIAPSAQVLWNEISVYSSAAEAFDTNRLEYQAKSKNQTALIASAMERSKSTEEAYTKVLAQHGVSSWRTVQAKTAFDENFNRWQSLSKELATIQAPAAPQLSNQFTEAIQSIAVRLGLFSVVILLMFVKRRI